ncbi:MAG: tyrosine-type recombinase/integrase [Candidatus Micrarchaeota archaeon]|nr:tyrosine-type recombinase/integrase [Candidatus Micrarchaeota archaeon]
MENPYIDNGEVQIRTQLRRINKLEEPNKSYALQFKVWMELQNRAKRTIAKRLDELIFVLKELGDKDAKRATKADIERIVIAINNARRKDGKPIATISRGKIKMTLRKFYKFLLKSSTYPKIVEDIRPDRVKNALLPTDMLSEADVESLIRQCRNPRDKALLSLLWSGLRVGELLTIRMNSIRIENDEVDITVTGKSGQRTIALLNPTYLISYIHQMRSNAEPMAPLFVKLQNGIPTEDWLSYMSLKKMLHDLKCRIPELKGRRIYAHLFRHSFASFLAGQNFNPEVMRRYFGWASNEMANVYVHLNDQTVKSAIRALGNREMKIPEPKLIPKECWRCHLKNEPDAEVCARCSAYLDQEKIRRGQIDRNAEMQALRDELAEIKSMLTKGSIYYPKLIDKGLQVDNQPLGQTLQKARRYDHKSKPDASTPV